MVTTAQDIVDAAMGRSLKNIPNQIATGATELLKTVNRAMDGLYAFAARVNPLFFADSLSVAYSAPGWARPPQAESVFRIEDPSFVEVVVVPYDQRDAEPGKPALYRLGQVFRSAGNTNDPTSGNLTFFYSKRPTAPAALANTLDSLWAETFNELLSLEVAIYLALKDGRAEEIQGLMADRDRWVTLFVAFLEHETANERRAYGHAQRFTGPSLIPLTALLAGGKVA